MLVHAALLVRLCTACVGPYGATTVSGTGIEDLANISPPMSVRSSDVAALVARE